MFPNMRSRGRGPRVLVRHRQSLAAAARQIGSTPLHVAAQFKADGVAKILLGHNATVDAPDQAFQVSREVQGDVGPLTPLAASFAVHLLRGSACSSGHDCR